MKTDWNGDEVGTAAFCESNPIIKGMLTQLAALLRAREDAKKVRFIVDWRKGNDPRFVEVETLDGKSCSIPWDQSYPGTGLYSMTLFDHPPTDSAEAKYAEWDSNRYSYTKLFNAIGDVVEWMENRTLGISVKAFNESMSKDAMSAESREGEKS